MELRTLNYFLAVYETGSISNAAKKCFISQPSITAAIKQLELDLDTKLFIRHARGVLPSASADKLYPQAKELTQRANLIANSFKNDDSPTLLRLGIMRSIGASRMSKLLKAIVDKVENVELTLVDETEPSDMRIVLGKNVKPTENFIPIWKDLYKIGVPSNWKLAKEKEIKFSDLDKLPFINREPCVALKVLKQELESRHIEFQTRANIRTIEYAWKLVGAGIGAAFLPNWSEIESSKEITLLSIESLNEINEIGLAYNKSKSDLDLITDVREVCESIGLTPSS